MIQSWGIKDFVLYNGYLVTPLIKCCCAMIIHFFPIFLSNIHTLSGLVQKIS